MHTLRELLRAIPGERTSERIRQLALRLQAQAQPNVLDLQRQAFLQGIFQEGPANLKQAIAFQLPPRRDPQGNPLIGPAGPNAPPRPPVTQQQAGELLGRSAFEAIRPTLQAGQPPTQLGKLLTGREITPLDFVFGAKFPIATAGFLGLEQLGRFGGKAAGVNPEAAATAAAFSPLGLVGGAKAAQALPGAFKFAFGAGGPLGGFVGQAAARGLGEGLREPLKQAEAASVTKLQGILKFINKPQRVAVASGTVRRVVQKPPWHERAAAATPREQTLAPPGKITAVETIELSAVKSGEKPIALPDRILNTPEGAAWVRAARRRGLQINRELPSNEFAYRDEQAARAFVQAVRSRSGSVRNEEISYLLGFPRVGGTEFAPQLATGAPLKTQFISSPRQQKITAQREVLRGRVAAAQKALDKAQGEKAFEAARGELTGALTDLRLLLPDELVLNDLDVLTLTNAIKNSSLPLLSKIRAQLGMLAISSGAFPERNQEILLERIFGKELGRALRANKSFGRRVFEQTVDIANMPRTFLTSYDLSFPLRQGALLAPGHPREFAGAWGPMFRAALREDAATQITAGLRAKPRWDLAQRSGLFEASLEPGAPLTKVEQFFLSRIARRIPGVRMSERGFAIFGNKLRFDIFDNVVAGWERQGKQVNDDDLRLLARFLNHATGRGDIPGGLEQFIPILNVAFFSPRLFASRLQLPGDIIEAGLRRSPAFGVMAKDLAAFVGTGVAILSVLKMSGAAEVELDPRSSDFGKAKIGKQRIELWAGYQPIARYTAQLIRGERKTSIGGIVPADRGNTVFRFIRSKAGPPGSLVTDVVTGTSFIGEDFEPTPAGIRTQAFNRLVPLFIQDLVEAIREEGASGFPVAGAFFGAGVQTFETRTQKKERTAREEAEANPELFGENAPLVIENGTKGMTAQQLRDFEKRNPEHFDPREETIEKRSRLAEIAQAVSREEIPVDQYPNKRGQIQRSTLIDADFPVPSDAPLRVRVTDFWFRGLEEKEQEALAEVLDGRDRLDAEREIRAEALAEFGQEGLDALDEVLTASGNPLEREFLLDRALLDKEFQVGSKTFSWATAGDGAWQALLREDAHFPEVHLDRYDSFDDFLEFVRIQGQQQGKGLNDSRVVRRFYEIRSNARNRLAHEQPAVGVAVLLWGLGSLRKETREGIAHLRDTRLEEILEAARQDVVARGIVKHDK